MLDNLRENLMGDDSIKYIDSFSRYRTELPLAFSWATQSGSLNPDDLYNENDSDYLVYASGVHQTAISARSVDRFGGISVTLVSGSASFYVQAGDTVWDPDPDFVGGPYTVSGDASGQSLYIGTHYTSTPVNPEFIHIPASGEYKIVFPKPLATKALIVTHSGDAPYAISKMIPRRAVQAFDLEVNAIKAYHVSADLIEAITLEVSDSIVVGPELIGDKTIDGRKIIDGTVSGVLITPGTVTGNLIQAGTISGTLITGGTITGDKIVAGTISGELISADAITADKINVTNLSAVNASTGDLSVNGTLTVTSGQILAGKAKISNTGIDIVSASGVGRVDSLRIMGNANTGSLEGIGFYNTYFSSTTPMAVLSTNWNNVFGISMPYDLSPGGYSIFQIGFNSSSGGQVKILEGGLDIVKGALYIYDSLGTSLVSTVDNTGQAEFLSNVQTQSFLSTRNGSSTSPAFSWLSDLDTGFYKYADGGIAITSNTVVTTAFFEGQTLFENGTELLPSIVFRLDSNTGFYRPINDSIGFVTGGVESMRLLSNNVLTLNGTNQNGQLTVEVPNGTARNSVALRQLNDASAYINFVSNTVTASTPIQTSALGAYAGKVRVQVNGVVRWIPFYQ